MAERSVYWIVTHYPHAYNVQAGIFYKSFAEKLVEKGLDLTVIAPAPFSFRVLSAISGKWKSYAMSPEKEEVNGVKIFRPRYFSHPFEVKAGVPHRFMLQAIRSLRLKKPAIVHAFGGFPAGYAAVRYANGMGVPVINTFTGSDANEYPFLSNLTQRRFRYITSHSDRLLAVSAALAAKVTEVSGKPAETVYLPVSATIPPSVDRTVLRDQLGIKAGQFILLYAGYLYETKGIRELTAALRVLSADERIQAVFCGGASPLLKEVIELPNVRYAGQLPIAEVMQWMQAADVLVLPSYDEGLPGVIKEAGMNGLPVIATHVGGIPELIGTDRGYLIAPKDADAIAKAVLHVQHHPAEAKERANKLKEVVHRMFDPETCADKQLEIYRQMMATK